MSIETAMDKMADGISARVPVSENEYIGGRRSSALWDLQEECADENKVPRQSKKTVRCICDCKRKELEAFEEKERQQEKERKRKNLLCGNEYGSMDFRKR